MYTPEWHWTIIMCGAPTGLSNSITHTEKRNYGTQWTLSTTPIQCYLRGKETIANNNREHHPWIFIASARMLSNRFWELHIISKHHNGGLLVNQ